MRTWCPQADSGLALAARRAVGLTQAELARRAGIRPETLNRIERGKATPSIPTIGKITRAIEQAQADAEAES